MSDDVLQFTTDQNALVHTVYLTGRNQSNEKTHLSVALMFFLLMCTLLYPI